MAQKASEHWQIAQIKAFSAWANYYLQRRGLHLDNIVPDIKDGTLLINLLELLYDDSVGKYYNPPKSRTFQIENANIALRFMKKHRIPNRGCSAEDIVDGSVTMILGMIWTIAREAQMDAGGLLKMNRKSSTNLTDSKPESQDFSKKERERDKEVEKMLLRFIKERTDYDLKEFGVEDWTDGKILGSLVSSFVDSALYLKDSDSSPLELIEESLSIAHDSLGIPSLFGPEELATGEADVKSLMLYTSMFMNHQKEKEKEEEILKRGALEAQEKQRLEEQMRRELEERERKQKQEESEKQKRRAILISQEMEKQRIAFDEERKRQQALQRQMEEMRAQEQRAREMEEQERLLALEEQRRFQEEMAFQQARQRQMEEMMLQEQRAREMEEQQRMRAYEEEQQRQRAEEERARIAEEEILKTEEEAWLQEQIQKIEIQKAMDEERARQDYEKQRFEEGFRTNDEGLYTQFEESERIRSFSSSPPSLHFPNMPIGGEFQGAAYVVGSNASVQYNPMASSSTTSSITATRGRKSKGIFAIANRVVQECAHKFDKAYAFVSDNDTSFSVFRKYFRFQQYEPLYGEFPCKIASTDEHMMIGAMYITPNYLCFTGELLNNRLSVILSYADIEDIEEGVTSFKQRYKTVPTILPASSSRSKPNALLVHDTQGKLHRLFSFTDTLKAWQTVYGIWQSNPLRVQRIQAKGQTKEPTLQFASSTPAAPVVTLPSPLPSKPYQVQTTTFYNFAEVINPEASQSGSARRASNPYYYPPS